MSSNNSGLEFFKGMLFGGAVGAVLGLLYAPKSGRESREELKKKSLAYKDDAEAKLELAQKKAEELLAETKKQLEEYRTELQTKVGEVKHQATHVLEDGKTVVEQQKHRIKDAIDAGMSAYKDEKANKRTKK